MLPSMMHTDGVYAAGNGEIAEQLGPCDDHPCSVASTLTGFADIFELDVSATLSSCPKDIWPGFDAITYPFLQWLHHAFLVDF